MVICRVPMRLKLDWENVPRLVFHNNQFHANSLDELSALYSKQCYQFGFVAISCL